jgi:hypothetical protein
MNNFIYFLKKIILNINNDKQKLSRRCLQRK